MGNNKRPLTVFLGVLISTVFFYLFASGGSLLAGNWLFPSKNFGENTYIGPYDVSDFREAQTSKVLSEGVTDLQGRFDVDVFYQDASFKLPPEAVSYNVSETIEGASTGAENPLVVHVNEESIRTLLDQNFGSLGFTEDETRSISEGIERRLRNGLMPANIQITDFLDASRAEQGTAVASASFGDQPITEGLIDGLAAIDGYRIEPGSSVSFLQMLEDTHAGSLNREEMTRIASILYATVLQTNFIVDERSISERLPEGIPVGYEAAIDPFSATDLMFTNPNGTSFTISTGLSENGITASLQGLPLFYDYSTNVTGMEEYKPRTIRQFSENVKSAAPRIEEPGKNGIRATVLKHVFNGPVEEQLEEVSTDFYQPVHRLEVHRLKPEEQPPSADGGSGSDGTPENLGDGSGAGNMGGGNSTDNENNGPSGSSSGNESNSSSTGGHSENGSGSGSSGSSEQGSSSGGQSGGVGSGNSNPGSENNGSSGSGSGGGEETQYDKGGNPIRP